VFMRRANKWRLVKEGKPYLANKYKGKKTITLIYVNQTRSLIKSNKKFMMLIENQRGEAYKDQIR
jgi:hypothetical protein